MSTDTKKEIEAIARARRAPGGKLGAMADLIRNPNVDAKKQEILTDFALGMVLGKTETWMKASLVILLLYANIVTILLITKLITG